MSGAALHRRLDRLAHRYGLSAGRLIVVTMHESRAHDDSLLSAALADAGISRTDQDLVVIVKRYGRHPAEPPCALVSVMPLHPQRRGTMRQPCNDASPNWRRNGPVERGRARAAGRAG
jgi:hypothetical protein